MHIFHHFFRKVFGHHARRVGCLIALICFATSTAQACNGCGQKSSAQASTAVSSATVNAPAPVATAIINMPSAPAAVAAPQFVPAQPPVTGLFSLPAESTTTTTTTTTSGGQAVAGTFQPTAIVAAPVVAVRLGPLQALRLRNEQLRAARQSALLVTTAAPVVATSASAVAIASTGAVAAPRARRGLFGRCN